VDVNSVIEAMDAETIYDVPILMLKEKLDSTVISKLRLKDKREPDLREWKAFLGKLKNPLQEVKIGLVGKYNELQDAYKSIYEAFIHAGAVNECKVKVVPIHSERLESTTDFAEVFAGFHGILVAPGFGERGIEGKLRAIQYVRENNIPFFGICLGMQCACVEFARNVAGLENASSSEVNPTSKHLIIDLMSEQKKIKAKGGTMRLGAYTCDINDTKSNTYKAYKKKSINERHRHRYEFNNDYLEKLTKAGLKIVGTNPETNLVEIIELENHPWFVGVQFHPELKSTVENPHPLFVDFVKAAMKV
jgi:CTP synthase